MNIETISTEHPAGAASSELLDHPDLWRAGELRRPPETVPSGFAELDAHLPGGGWPRAGLSELLFDTAGIGELRLLLPALRVLSQQMRWIAWVNPPFVPYAPALHAAGIDISRILLIHPKQRSGRQQRKQQHQEALWALERASRSGTCSAVLAWLDERQLSVPDTRRLQLAARQGNTLACLFRPGSAAAMNSMAELRLAVRPVGSGMAESEIAGSEIERSGAEVRICKRRGGWPVEGIRVPIGERRTPDEVREQLSLWRHWRGVFPPAERAQTLEGNSAGRREGGKTAGQALQHQTTRPVTH